MSLRQVPNNDVDLPLFPAVVFQVPMRRIYLLGVVHIFDFPGLPKRLDHERLAIRCEVRRHILQTHARKHLRGIQGQQEGQKHVVGVLGQRLPYRAVQEAGSRVEIPRQAAAPQFDFVEHMHGIGIQDFLH